GIAYVILLAPVAGLTPTGVQASADRYMYVPSVVIAIAVGLGLARVRMHGHMRALVALATAGALTLLALLTRSQTRYWKDSIAVWSRAAAIDPRNDVAPYNPGVPPAGGGRGEEGMRPDERALSPLPGPEPSGPDLR